MLTRIRPSKLSPPSWTGQIIGEGLAEKSPHNYTYRLRPRGYGPVSPTSNIAEMKYPNVNNYSPHTQPQKVCKSRYPHLLHPPSLLSGHKSVKHSRDEHKLRQR